jgi:hypothetical protein
MVKVTNGMNITAQKNMAAALIAAEAKNSLSAPRDRRKKEKHRFMPREMKPAMHAIEKISSRISSFLWMRAEFPVSISIAIMVQWLP